MSIDFVIDDERIVAKQVERLCDEHEPTFREHRRVAVYSEKPLPLIISLLLCEKLNLNIFLCHSYFKKEAVKDILQEYGCDLLVEATKTNSLSVTEYPIKVVEPVKKNSSSINIFTTGTTGSPKLSRHSWSSVSDSARYIGNRLQGKTYLMTYLPTGYAGLQVYFSALRNNGTIVFEQKKDFENFCRQIVKYRIEIISATPTFWRLLINSWPKDLSAVNLKQATLGGEAVSQDILNGVDSFFCPERLTHIYASTEVGSAIVVSDKQAGFPESYLDQTRKVKLRLREGVLEANSPTRMSGYVNKENVVDQEGWISTGDLVEKKGSRYFIKGRNDGRINIGGNKVLPEEVEAALLELDDIRDCLVYEKKNPIVGSLLAADLVPCNPKESKLAVKIKSQLKAKLPDYKIPQLIRKVERIGISENGKKIRI